MNFLEELEEYFKNTPREKVLSDWEKSRDCDSIGPTVSDFLDDNLGILKMENKHWYGIAKIVDRAYEDDFDYIKEKIHIDKHDDIVIIYVISGNNRYNTVKCYFNDQNEIYKITSFEPSHYNPPYELGDETYARICSYLRKMNLISVLNRELWK